MTNALSRVMRSAAKHPRGPHCPVGETRFFAALRMTRPGHFLIACHDKRPLACHAERQRSIWSHQPDGVAHPGCFAALRMTCPGGFFTAGYEEGSGTCHAERSEGSEAPRRAAWPTSDSSLRSE